MAKDNCIRNMKKSITIPVKKVTKQVAPKTKPVTPKDKAPKVTAKVQAKAHRTTIKAPQETPQQASQLQLSDFRLQTTADNIGIHITTTYLGNAIHRFTLPVAEYAGWQRANPQRKYVYVQARTVVSAFFGDLRITNSVVTKTIQILDNLFARVQAQQQQIGSVITK
jgi:hypothetical protein